MEAVGRKQSKRAVGWCETVLLKLNSSGSIWSEIK